MRRIWMLVAVAFPACKSSHEPARGDAPLPPIDTSDAPPADDAPASGTRLKLTWVDFGGTRTHPGIYDSQLGQACRAQTWADGEEYCTPDAAIAFQYEDDHCTQPIIEAATPVGALAMTIAASPAVPCAPTAITGVYEAGDEINNAQLYELSDGTCIGPVAMGQTVRRTVPIPASSFVRLDRVPGSAPTRLVPRWITSSDGLRMPDGFFDRELGAACAFEVGDDRLVGRCMPANHHIALGFLDANCQTPATWQNPSACTVPWFASPRIDVSTTCAVTTPTVHGQGSVIDHFFEKIGTSCREQALMPSQVPYALGPALDLVQSQLVHDPEGPRITHVRHQTASGVLEDPERLFDHLLGTECIADAGPTIGTFVCAPADFVRTALSGFSDANCQTPTIVVELDQGPASCPVPNPGTYVSRGTNFYMHVEGMYTTPFYVDFVTCAAVQQPAFTARFRATRVDASVFAPGVPVTE